MIELCIFFICLKETLQYTKANKSAPRDHVFFPPVSTAENMDGWEGANASCTVSLSESDGEGGDRDIYVGA